MEADLISASSIAGVLVLIRKLYQEGAVNEEEKGQLKDAVLGNHNEVCIFNGGFCIFSIFLGGPLVVLVRQSSSPLLYEEQIYVQVLLSSFVRFVADGDKEALVAALLAVLGQHNPKLAGPVSSPEVYGNSEERNSLANACMLMEM